MAKIFISYSRRDMDEVDSLIEVLESAKHDVWVDRQDIRAGAQWQTSIVQAIIEADYFILALSPNSIKSDNVRRELVIAANNQKQIIPICIEEDVEPPYEMQYQLAGLQRITIPKNLPALLSALEETPTQSESTVPKSFSGIKKNVVWKIFGLLVLVSSIVVITILVLNNLDKPSETPIATEEIPSSQTPDATEEIPPSQTPIVTEEIPPSHTPVVTEEIPPSQTPEIFPIDDISVMQKDNGPEIELDIKVRNLGENVAVLKKAHIYIQDIKSFRYQGCEFRDQVTTSLSVSGEYDFDISDLDVGQSKERSLSQAISANSADRFKITLIPKSEFGYWLLYKIKLELIYNHDNLSVFSIPIIFISSKSNESTQSAELLYGYQLSDEDLLTKYDSFYNNSSEEEIISEFRACFDDNLHNATAIFSEQPFFISEEAEVEYNEWKRFLENTP